MIQSLLLLIIIIVNIRSALKFLLAICTPLITSTIPPKNTR